MSFVKNLAVFGEHLPNSFKIFPKSELCKGANQTRFSILSTPNPIKPTYASQPCNLFFNHTKTGTISWIKIPGSWSSSDQTFSLAGPLLTVSQHFFHEKTRKGLTTLHQASFSTASFEQIEHLKRVFKVAQADPDANEGDLYSVYIRAAYKACKEGQWNLIEKFDPEFFSTLKDKQGRTLLSLCIENGEEKIISELLQRKIGVNEKDSKGNTPLHIAARLNFPSLLKVLLHYFSPDAHNFRGETALHLATQNGQEQTLGILLEYTELEKQRKLEGNLLHWAIYCGQFRVVDYLLTHYYSNIQSLIEERDTKGRTPLALAAYLGEALALYTLAKHGANFEAADHRGNSPIHWACEGLQLGSVICLAQLKANFSALNNEDQRAEDLLRLKKDEASKQFLRSFIDVQTSSLTKEFTTPLTAPPRNLVFQGGGPKGIAHLAALEELEKRKSLGAVERVAGTSAGAISAGLIAVGYTSEELKKKLNEQNLTEWLDYPPELENQVAELKERLSDKLPQIISQGVSKLDVAKGLFTYFYKKITLSHAKKEALKEAWNNGGFCEGKEFLDWMESAMKKATGIDYCTFGDLADFVNGKKTLPGGQAAKHPYLVATKIGSDPTPVYFSSEDPACKEIIISDAIRMSMSIPIVYKPHLIHKRDAHGKRYPFVEGGYFVDGGLLENFPIKIFDYKKYKEVLVPGENPDEPWYNPQTWGFSLYSSEKQEPSVATPTIVDVIKNCASLLWNSEMTLKESQSSNRDRMIRIDNQGIGLLDFDLSDDKKQLLIEAGRKETQNFLRTYSLGILGRSSDCYDIGLLQKKIAEGFLSLSYPHVDFVGRKEELQELERDLLNRPSWRQDSLIKIINGPTGYGKSELATAFACSHLDKFSYMWQIDLRNQETFERSYIALAHALGISTRQGDRFFTSIELCSKVNARLEQNGSLPWLLIFDNVDQAIQVPLPQKGGCILITSQLVEVYTNLSLLELKPFSKLDASTLIEDITGEKGRAVEELAQDLQYIPLLINQAAHYIAHTPLCSAQDYQAQLRKKVSSVSSANYQELFTACWSIASAYLKEKLPETIEWLTLCSYLNNRSIPKEWLTDWLAKRAGVNASLKQFRQQRRILDLLQSYGLIYGHPYDKTFSLHGLLQKIILNSQDSTQSILVEEFISFLIQLSEVRDYNPTHPTALGPFQQALPHCISILEHLKERQQASQQIRLVLTMVRYWIETERNLIQAEKYLQLADSLVQDVKGPFKGRILFLYGLVHNKKASSETDPNLKKGLQQRALSSFQEAAAIFSSCLDSSEYVLLEQNADKCNSTYQKAISIEYQAQTYLELKLLDQANAKLDEAMLELKKLYPDGKHYDIARIMREKAKILMRRGEWVAAEQRIREVLNLQRIVYDSPPYKGRFDSHSTVAVTYMVLGDIYLAQKAWNKAEDAYHEAIKINKKAYNTKFHPYIARLYEKRASVAEQLGDRERADAMREKAAKIKEFLNKHRG